MLNKKIDWYKIEKVRDVLTDNEQSARTIALKTNLARVETVSILRDLLHDGYIEKIHNKHKVFWRLKR
jgi:predicted transcriptional regulator